MANIKLKNGSGVETTYSGVTSIKIPLASGSGTATFSEGGGSIGYDVTLNVDGTTWQVIQVLQGNSIDTITSPSMSGSAFVGWSTTSGGSVNVTFPYTPSGNVTLYAVGVDWTCTVAGLGSSSPSSVTFSHSTTMPAFQEVTIGSDVFIRIPKIYRKVVSAASQITGYILSTEQVDSTYHIYPCFLKEDGTTEMDYILIGKYCSTSATAANSVGTASAASMTIGAGRTLCQAKGTGYLQMDW